MAILEVKEMGARTVKVEANGSRSYTRRWKITTDTPEHGGKQILDALPVRRGDVYQIGTVDEDGNPDPATPWAEREENVFCVGIDAAQSETEGGEEDGATWIAVATYQPWSADFAGIENPLDEPVLISYDAQPFVRIADFAFDDENAPTVPVVNTASDLFDPAVEADDTRRIMVIVKNVKSVDIDWIDLYNDVTNADEFLGRPPGTVLNKPIRAEEAFHSTIGKYVRLTFEMHIDRDGWKRVILNRGFRQLNTDGDGYETILTETGQPPSDPVPLDAEGRAITDPDAELLGLEFKLYRSLPFAAFGITSPGT